MRGHLPSLPRKRPLSTNAFEELWTSTESSVVAEIREICAKYSKTPAVNLVTQEMPRGMSKKFTELDS